MPKIYDKNIKTEAVKRYKNGENIDKIANDLNIKAGSQLIRIWYKSSKSCYSYSIYKDCNEVKLMSQKLKKRFYF
ncbi:hypothetical protein SAPIS_v1c04820 [Spiroplasma apis B31]|uniref:Transposase n=1 Tax=Spiroplasma apis B31 TaxID=1276258 RepID=V5RI12_SPIAP|nr:hypothetical protein SAPIS_v1c04820 [Spiroplasma apis B31]